MRVYAYVCVCVYVCVGLQEAGLCTAGILPNPSFHPLPSLPPYARLCMFLCVRVLVYNDLSRPPPFPHILLTPFVYYLSSIIPYVYLCVCV